MAYRTLMVHLRPGVDNEGALAVTAALAVHFDAGVIGTSACQPFNPMYEEGFAAGDVVAGDRVEINRELAAAEARFRTVLGGRARML